MRERDYFLPVQRSAKIFNSIQLHQLVKTYNEDGRCLYMLDGT